jgi:hypothetical protein
MKRLLFALLLVAGAVWYLSSDRKVGTFIEDPYDDAGPADSEFDSISRDIPDQDPSLDEDLASV